MAWVKAEYAPELAVLSAWLSALLPWSVSLQLGGPLGSVLFFVRWPVGELQVRVAPSVTVGNESVPVGRVLDAAYPGNRLWGPFHLADPFSATAGYGSTWVAGAGAAWLLGTFAIAVAVALSIALYRDEPGTTARLPVDPVRATAGLLALAVGGYALATIGLWLGPPRLGLALPVGVVVIGALAAVLARVERI